MLFNLENATATENYKALTNAVTPRPLMWILTEISNKNYTVAPYSFVNILSTEEPLISIAFGRRKNGEIKGTLKSFKETGQAVLHLTTEANLPDIRKSSEQKSFIIDENDLSYEVNDFLPMVKNAPIALFCEFCDMIDISSANTHLVICRVKHIYTDRNINYEKFEPLVCVGDSGIITLKKQ